jgi:uncharacterized protein (TIGR04551 family)
MQIDVLDNLVLGSTYGGDGNTTDLRLGAFGDTQDAPVAGVNSIGNSIAVKRAWAEINAPIGVLKFGRQPWHWGMGMVANGGGNDPIHGTYNLDADFGDTVDRVMLSVAVPGTKLNAGLAVDWSQMGPTSAQTGEQSDRGRQAWDLDDADDLDQWLLMLSHMDSPTQIADKLADGELILNYGAFLAYRTQKFAQTVLNFGEQAPSDDYVRRDLTSYIPNVWVHIAKGKFDFEAELVTAIGDLKAPEAGITDTIDIRQFGGVAKVGYKLLDDDLKVGLEGGFASGDRHDNVVPGRIHVSGAQNLGVNDTKLQQFMFDKNYHVDMILFRELMGTVSNAIYAKPSFQYDLTSKFMVSGAGILSMAHRKEATPGNSDFYGVEFNGDVGYHNDGFFAGISYGIFLPMAAMDHPGDPVDGSAGFGFGRDTRTASTAQTIQTRLMLQF